MGALRPLPTPFEQRALPPVIGDRYELQELIGQGGMGDVWSARHTALGVRVAIKFLQRAFASSEQTRKRFLTEAQVAARLKTRNAVQVFDFGITEAGQPYLVMELLDGESLAARIRREGMLAAAQTVNYLKQAARALDRAHALGIVHRDLKPENVFLTFDEEGTEQVKVVDFGIAKLIGDLDLPEDDLPTTNTRRDPRATLAKTAGAVGTPYYMSPEQVRNEPNLGPQADVWALGVVAYECLTGQLPFEAEDTMGVFHRILHAMHPLAQQHRPDLPASFDRWFMKCCAPSPLDRFQGTIAAVAALGEALDVKPMRSSGEQPTTRDRSGDHPAITPEVAMARTAVTPGAPIVGRAGFEATLPDSSARILAVTPRGARRSSSSTAGVRAVLVAIAVITAAAGGLWLVRSGALSGPRSGARSDPGVASGDRAVEGSGDNLPKKQVDSLPSTSLGAPAIAWAAPPAIEGSSALSKPLGTSPPAVTATATPSLGKIAKGKPLAPTTVTALPSPSTSAMTTTVTPPQPTTTTSPQTKSSSPWTLPELGL